MFGPNGKKLLQIFKSKSSIGGIYKAGTSWGLWLISAVAELVLLASYVYF